MELVLVLLFGLPILLILLFMGWAQIADRPRRTQHDPNLCPKCGYDLRAGPDRCPECGRARPPRFGG